MGYTVHDAIVVTAFKAEHAERAREKAVSLGLRTSALVISAMNSWHSFFIAPDGSKEGWPDSDMFDKLRSEWVAWARDAHKEDVWLHFVAVRYGGDLECAPCVTASNSDDDMEPA